MRVSVAWCSVRSARCDDPGELAAALGFVQFVGERCLRLCHSGAAFAARYRERELVVGGDPAVSLRV